MSSDDAKYGTFPTDKGKDEVEKTEVEFEWEGFGAPWALFISAMIIIGKNAAALLLLYCTLLRGQVSKQNLMVCNPTVLSAWQTWGCEYTKAFLRAFPLLAMCVTLCIAMRLIVQQRVYYGFLKRGGLLDFKNVEGWRDPLLLVLVVSVIHSIAHFGLKLTDGNGDMVKEATQVVKNFIVPYVIFLAFLYDSNDIEKLLVPLNKYVEEDPEYARKVLGSIVHMDEDFVRTDVMSRDVVAAAIAAEGPSIEAVYMEIIRSYPEVKARLAGSENTEVIQFHMKNSMWPAGILIDGRLLDEKTVSFRGMFRLFLVACTLVQVVVFGLFFHQAVLKDLYFDWWIQGEEQDVVGAIVLLVHAAFVARIMQVTLLPITASLAGDSAHMLADQVGTSKA